MTDGAADAPKRAGDVAVIYFTQDTQNKAIKIGYSKNPTKRRSGLQSATANPLVLLGAIHGGRLIGRLRRT